MVYAPEKFNWLLCLCFDSLQEPWRIKALRGVMMGLDLFCFGDAKLLFGLGDTMGHHCFSSIYSIA